MPRVPKLFLYLEALLGDYVKSFVTLVTSIFPEAYNFIWEANCIASKSVFSRNVLVFLRLDLSLLSLKDGWPRFSAFFLLYKPSCFVRFFIHHNFLIQLSLFLEQKFV